ncbi:hypothetical protein DSO57_1004378 [Entomophthora muscae]|uniref:Uncharacterized protein n=1 Tax=Entomophthora muscae TaxID=34485 RepID=A0ACC2U7R0_9FUNG|nr:hypothetical protein DSO57_1004378 [Entomophthora muscae]
MYISDVDYPDAYEYSVLAVPKTIVIPYKLRSGKYDRLAGILQRKVPEELVSIFNKRTGGKIDQINLADKMSQK